MQKHLIVTLIKFKTEKKINKNCMIQFFMPNDCHKNSNRLGNAFVNPSAN